MVIEISETTMKRLTNYADVMKRHYRDAEKRQWTTMTLEAMQRCERVKQRAQHISATVAYSQYLYLVQKGLTPTRSIYGEPLLSRALIELMNELDIPVRMTAEGSCH